MDTVTDDLEGHKTQLLRDITSLDKLYDANLDYFHNLEFYILAGERKLGYIDNNMVQRQKKRQKNSDEVLAAQELRDVRSGRDDLERRIHDLKLTRQVAMQAYRAFALFKKMTRVLSIR